MKKNLLLLLFFLATGLQAQEKSSMDQSNFYIEFLSGPNFLQNTTADGNQSQYHTGYVVGGSLGFSLYNGLCLEAEYAFRKNGIKQIDFFTEGSSTSGHFQTSSFMANLMWEILPWKFWDTKPFFGAGAGYDFQQMSSSNSRIVFDQDWQHFSWQLMAGFVHQIFYHTDIVLEYKFHQGGSQFNNHAIEVGLIYNFGFFSRKVESRGED